MSLVIVRAFIPVFVGKTSFLSVRPKFNLK